MFNTLPLLSNDLYNPIHIPDTWSQLYFYSQWWDIEHVWKNMRTCSKSWINPYNCKTVCSIYISAGTTLTHSLTICSKYRDVLFHTAMSFIPLSIYTVDTKTYLELIAKLTSSLVHNRSDVRILWWPVVWKCCQTHIKHHCLFTKISSGILRSSMSRVVVPWNTLTIGNFCSQTFMGEKWGWCCIRV